MPKIAPTPAITPPIAPMLARAADALPAGDGFLFEPRWEGLRALVFQQGGQLLIQGADLKPLNRYFPELERALAQALPKGCVLDGVIVVPGPAGLDFEALQRRIHPAPARVARMAKETPSAYIAFDLLAAGGRSTTALPQTQRRERLERLLGRAQAPLYLTPATRDRALAQDWLERFGGAGLDGVMAKPVDGPYRSAKRALFKLRLPRTADCVVAGLRWQQGRDDTVGALLLGLHDETGVLRQVGEISELALALRIEMARELAPLRENALDKHPWRAQAGDGEGPAWVPLRPERVCEVRYEHQDAGAFRGPQAFVRWRADKQPAQCGLDQLQAVAAPELAQLLRAKARP